MIWSFDKSAMDKVQSATDKLLLFEHELRMTYGDGKVSWLRSIWAVCLVKRIMGWMGSSLWCIRRMPGWRKTRSTVEYLAVFLVQRMLTRRPKQLRFEKHVSFCSFLLSRTCLEDRTAVNSRCSCANLLSTTLMEAKQAWTTPVRRKDAFEQLRIFTATSCVSPLVEHDSHYPPRTGAWP